MATAEANWLWFDDTRFDESSFSSVWLLALGTYGVGDIVTTIALVYFVPLFTEANPVIRFAIETFGGGGFLGLKLLVFYAAIGVSLWAGKEVDDPLLFYGPPLALAVVGLWTTFHNLNLIL
jgi:hypothetical protein